MKKKRQEKVSLPTRLIGLASWLIFAENTGEVQNFWASKSGFLMTEWRERKKRGQCIRKKLVLRPKQGPTTRAFQSSWASAPRWRRRRGRVVGSRSRVSARAREPSPIFPRRWSARRTSPADRGSSCRRGWRLLASRGKARRTEKHKMVTSHSDGMIVQSINWYLVQWNMILWKNLVIIFLHLVRQSKASSNFKSHWRIKILDR